MPLNVYGRVNPLSSLYSMAVSYLVLELLSAAIFYVQRISKIVKIDEDAVKNSNSFVILQKKTLNL